MKTITSKVDKWGKFNLYKFLDIDIKPTRNDKQIFNTRFHSVENNQDKVYTKTRIPVGKESTY